MSERDKKKKTYLNGSEKEYLKKFNEQEIFKNANWMEKHETQIGHRTLRDIIMIGSHDAGSYSFKATSPFSKELEEHTALKVMKFHHSTICGWSKTQGRTILDQLKIGSRYFDIRVQYNKEQRDYRIHHGLIGAKLFRVFDDVKEFIKEHKKEIIILRLSHFLDFDTSAHVRLIKYINSVFKTKLSPPADPGHLTFNQLWEKGRQIILLYNDKDATKMSLLLWSLSFIDTKPWANTPSIDKMIKILFPKVREYPEISSNFVLTQFVLTPDKKLFLQNPLWEDKTLPKCNFDLSTISKPKIMELIRTWHNQNFRLNICMVDWVDPDFIDLCIELNLQTPKIKRTTAAKFDIDLLKQYRAEKKVQAIEEETERDEELDWNTLLDSGSDSSLKIHEGENKSSDLLNKPKQHQQESPQLPKTEQHSNEKQYSNEKHPIDFSKLSKTTTTASISRPIQKKSLQRTSKEIHLEKETNSTRPRSTNTLLQRKTSKIIWEASKKAPLHTNLEFLEVLVGTWKGIGEGSYPTLKNFDYSEEVQFTINTVGKPFLNYSQKTFDLESNRSLHSETGYLRAPKVHDFEFLVSQPSGLNSVETCHFTPPFKEKENDNENNEKDNSSHSLDRTVENSPKVFTFVLFSHSRAPSAKKPWVTAWKRVWKIISPTEMDCKFYMSTETTPEMTLHLSSTLYKQPN